MTVDEQKRLPSSCSGTLIYDYDKKSWVPTEVSFLKQEETKVQDGYSIGMTIPERTNYDWGFWEEKSY